MADRVTKQPSGWPLEDVFVRQLSDPAFAATVVDALKAGTLPGDLEAAFWQLRFGEPTDVDR